MVHIVSEKMSEKAIDQATVSKAKTEKPRGSKEDLASGVDSISTVEMKKMFTKSMEVRSASKDFTVSTATDGNEDDNLVSPRTFGSSGTVAEDVKKIVSKETSEVL